MVISLDFGGFFTTTLINRYVRSAKEVIFSYVTQIEDRHVGPSSLIAELPEISLASLNLPTSASSVEKIYQSRKIEPLINDLAPKLGDNEITHAPSRLLELQSLCPFRAFMEFRLKIKESKKPSMGLSKSDRGIIIHKVLEQFWRQTKTKQQLDKLTEVTLKKSLSNNVEQTLKEHILSKELLALETQCLVSLLTSWLTLEKERPPFKVIAIEKSTEIKLSSLLFKLRIDRIDELDDGRTLIIDYKSGKTLPSSSDWFGPRPKNLQLPLYSLAVASVAGLALAQLNFNRVKLKEVDLKELAVNFCTIDINNTPKDTTITWHALTTYWHQTLTQIAANFISGDATITPLSPEACTHCNFNAACRIVW